ncbi:MAG: ATP-binding cassette domain-containing protein [Proteobacteria bacterium]|nr:ATP-binding cassette domain-containing protein [Pseudomonadota bacterium]
MSGTPMLEATLSKSYGGQLVLRGATIAAMRGTVHALVGENGAGKSTLVKIVAGVIRADRGDLVIDDRRIDVARWDRVAARRAGIGIVQQHGAMAGTLTVVENAVLGVEPRRAGLLSLAATADALVALGREIGMPIDPHARADRLGLGAAQRAEIVAALHHGAKLLVLDEPTAVLAPIEVDGLLATLRALARERGTTVIIVTHKLDEVRAVADDVTVLREGRTVTTFRPPLEPRAIARAMVGADLPDVPLPTPVAADAPVALALAGVTVGAALVGIDLTVRAGELVGVAGVDGNGQHELAHAIAGLVAVDAGTIALRGASITTATPRARLQRGLAHVPEDRHHGGLVLDASVADNLALGRADVTGRFVIDRPAVAAHATARIEELDIRPPDGAALASALSGGNQQKVVIGRELSRPGLAVVVAAQPTRGVDLGAVAKIHEQLRAAAASGAGVLVISADLDELLALCHRVVVLLRGELVGERVATAAARGEIGALMTGAKP